MHLLQGPELHLINISDWHARPMICEFFRLPTLIKRPQACIYAWLCPYITKEKGRMSESIVSNSAKKLDG